MANLANWIEAMAEGEDIEGAVIGHFPDRDGESSRWYTNKLIPWDIARPIIDYAFDKSLGVENCHPVYAWTKSWIISVTEYDGSHSPARIPRNPVSFKARYISDEIEDDEAKRLGINA